MEKPIANSLHAVEMGSGGVPAVLLHGFGSDSFYWRQIQHRLSRDRAAIAFDLPGHGGSLAVTWGRGTGAAADLVASEIDRRAIDRFHLCGHSLGGAVACVMAMKQPGRVASLTLLAPGGFGPEVNARLLRRYARASEEAQVEVLLEQFYGELTAVPKGMARRVARTRQRAGAREALAKIAESFLKGEEQGLLPLKEVAALGIPTAVIWGTQDRITPTRQAHKLPGTMATHVFDRVGHSIVDEIPDTVVQVISHNMR